MGRNKLKKGERLYKARWRRWSKAALRVPFKSRKNGIGNGERRLATQLGYRMSRPVIDSFDLIGPDGTVEVKHMGTDNRIRIGIVPAAWPMIEAMNDVRRFLDEYRSLLRSLLRGQELLVQLESLCFDIPAGRLRVDEIVRAPALLRLLREEVGDLPSEGSGQRTISELLRALSAARRAQRCLGQFFKADVLAIVDETGYCLIDKDEVQDFFEIHSMSQFRLMFGAKKTC